MRTCRDCTSRVDGICLGPLSPRVAERVANDDEACEAYDGGGMALEYLTVAEVAQLLRVSEYTVRRWLKTGELRGTKAEKFWLVPAAEVRRKLGQ